MKDRVIIGDYEFVAAEVPAGRRGRPPGEIAKNALAAMDQLGVDSVRVATGLSHGSTGSTWNRQAKRAGVPVKFVSRKVDGAWDVFAIHIKDGDQ